MTFQESAATTLWVTRQPLFNQRLETVAYQILYRAYPSTGSDEVDDSTSARMLLEMFDPISLEHLSAGKKVFIPASPALLFSDFTNIFPPHKVVLLVTPACGDDQRMLERLNALVNVGYQIAAGPVTELAPAVTRLSKLSQYLFTPLRRLDPLRIFDVVAQIRLYKTQLVALGIDTPEDLSACWRLRFDLAQGRFILQPRRQTGRRVDASHLTVMQTLAKVQDPSADFRTLGYVIAQDALLSQKLLAVVNSPTYSLSRPINTIEQAVAIIGIKQLRSILTLLTLASIPGKPPELTTLAMQRARLCELLAPVMGQPKAEIFFIAGLFSTLDALLDLPMAQAVADLPLAPEVTAALVEKRGSAYVAVAIAQALERGDWAGLARTGLAAEFLAPAFLKALRWSAEVSASINAK